MSDKIMSFFEKDRFAAFIGAKLVEVKPGYAKAMMEVSEKHLNAADVVQGGATFTLADLAFAAASNSHGQVSLAVNTTISYFRPPRGKILIAEAKEISLTNKLANYNIDVFDENQEHIARLTGMVYRKKDLIETA